MYPRDVILHSGQHLNFTIIGDSMFNEIIFLLILSYSFLIVVVDPSFIIWHLSFILPFLLYLLIKCYILINSMICYFCEDRNLRVQLYVHLYKFGKCFKYNHLSTTQLLKYNHAMHIWAFHPSDPNHWILSCTQVVVLEAFPKFYTGEGLYQVIYIGQK